MLRFVVRRLLLLVPILLGLSILIFVWVRALPGTPADALLGERATPADVAEFKHRYGLDQPIYTQYWDYLKTTLSGELGTSVASHRPVTTEIKERFPATVELAVAAMIFALAFGISMVRSAGLPSGPRRGVPSASSTGQWQPSQPACLMPLAKLQFPVAR